MASDSTKIIILEDDRTLLASLTSLCQKEGVEVFGASQVEEVRDLLAKHRVKTLFIDCLLPGESGVDFAKSLRDKYPKEILEIVLMSGIFTDPTFVKESLRDAEASQFLKKPFTNEEFLKTLQLQKKAQESGSHPRKGLYKLFNRPDASARDKRKAIEALEEIHGFDLPLVYNVLCEAKLSGHLNIVAENGDVSGIAFSNGSIVGVDIADRETYLGKLLIESGFLSPEDLNDTLAMKSTKKIGERLIQGNLLSPHGFNIVLSTQMSLRLSRTIVDQSVRINFVPSDIEATQPSIEGEQFESYLHDWIATRISYEWLKAHFTQWGHSRFSKSPLFEKKKYCLQLPMVNRLEGVVEKVTQGKTLQEILDAKLFPEEPLFKCLHFLLTSGVLAFQEGTQLSAADRLKMLKRMQQQFTKKSTLEVYELIAQMSNTSANRPESVFAGFQELVGPRPSEPTELVGVYDLVFKIGKQACESMKSGNREKLKEESTRAEAELKLKANALLEEASQLLQKGSSRQAMTLIRKAEEIDPQIQRLHLYLAWAKLGTLDQFKSKEQGLKEVDLELLQVDAEDKFDGIYHFVNGLFLKAKGDIPNAKKAFEKTLAMNNNLIAARRELTMLKSQEAGNKDIFNQDLKTLVGSLFAKKR